MNEKNHAPGPMLAGERLGLGIVAVVFILVTGYLFYNQHQKDLHEQESAQRIERANAYVKWVREYQPPPPSASQSQRDRQQAMEAWAACMDHMKAHVDTVTNSQIVSCGRLMP